MKNLVFSRLNLALTAMVLGIIGVLFTAALVKADTAPTVTTVVHNSAHSSITSATIGTLVHANVALASTGPAVTGTVDFSFYPNTTCLGTAVVEAGVALASNVAESSATSTPNTGLSYKAHYNGLTEVYPPTDGQCQPLTAISAVTTLNGTLSTTSVTVPANVFESSVLGGATASATGTVAYTVYTNNSCTVATTTAGTKTVTNAIVPNSDTIPFNFVGTFYWQAVYSGDQFNSPATSSCQTLAINAVPVTPPPPTSGSISGTVFGDINRSEVRDAGEVGLPGWTINLYSGNGWSHNGTVNPIMTVTSDGSGNYMFSNVTPGTYSIEEINQPGWDQTSDDFNDVIVVNGSIITNKNFGDASTTPNQGGHGNGFIGKCFKGFQNFWARFDKKLDKKINHPKVNNGHKGDKNDKKGNDD